ncbi:hypothetical protein Y032_0123g1153 [Ancylostoma ceylanicum]|nr:hypothetical protein Y032_0123g1153 [Ancylostoma ceylanicum]
MNFMGKIADTLVDAGHDVVTFQPIINDQLVGNGTLKSRLIQKDLVQETAAETEQLNSPANQLPFWTASATSPMGFIFFVPLMSSISRKSVSGVLSDEELLKQLREEKFDLVITELFEFIGVAVSEALGIKTVVGAHSNGCVFEGTALAIGLPVIPSYMPAAAGVTDDSSSLSTRTTNLFFTFLSWYMQTSMASAAEQAMVERLGSTAKPIWEIVSDMNWILTNSEPLLDFAKPTLNSVVGLGGIGVPEAKPLSKEWNDVLSLRRATVLISFGSVAPSINMPEEMKRAIIDVVKSYSNITFIWKYEQPDDPLVANVQNLFVSKWTPQSDLLADDRLSLFITHGGAGSMMEAATHGKPLIVVPLFGDQTRNAKLVEKYGFGILLEKSRMVQSAVIHDAIDKVLNDNKYHYAAVRIRRLLSRRPISPKEKLVKTIELVAEFGNLPEQRVAGRNLGFIVYYNIDLILILAFTLVSICGMFSYLLLRIFRHLFIVTKVKTQ